MSAEAEGAGRFGVRRSVFWRVAGILIGVQVATGLLAVGLSAYFAVERSRTLAANSLTLRLNDLAQEVELRGAPLDEGLASLSPVLRGDLASRFPDPIFLLDADGTPLATLPPDAEAFGGEVTPLLPARPLPEGLGAALSVGEIRLQLDEDAPAGTWGLVPVFDTFGVIGGLLVQPLTRSLDRELADTRAAFGRAVGVVAMMAGLIALLLGAFFTWQLVRPLRRMTRRVEQIGAGDYTARLALGTPDERSDEFGRLAAAINAMAAEVEASIDALRATDRLRRELIANVGHDLRTPLAALLGYVEEAERHLATADEAAARDALATAARQGQYLTRLVADLFELSLLGTPKPPLRREPIPLAELLTDAARSHHAAFARAEIDFALDLPDALPLLEADGVRLLRLLDNLLTNARHHTPPGGTVCLAASLVDGGAEVRVADSGEGMPPAVCEHIFERYYRGEGARTRTDRGTGLGLPIARAIARAHGGDLTVASTPGVGSVFTLRLPRDARA